MSYAVKEIFKTLQGEGAQMGRAAVFCRFAGCNLWSGREIGSIHKPEPGVTFVTSKPGRSVKSRLPEIANNEPSGCVSANTSLA